jgi:DNA-binding MarR family transcriptional regulator
VNAKSFQQLDKVIHEKNRMAIMSLLAATRKMSFTDIRESLNMTDGNLITHIRTLQKAGYISISKSFKDKRPLTTCRLTVEGSGAFSKYVNLLEGIVKQARKTN